MFLFLAQREKKDFLVLIIEKYLKIGGMNQILMFDFRFAMLFTINFLWVLQSYQVGIFKSCQMVEFHQHKKPIHEKCINPFANISHSLCVRAHQLSINACLFLLPSNYFIPWCVTNLLSSFVNNPYSPMFQP
jgi:hypothetical protein